MVTTWRPVQPRKSDVSIIERVAGKFIFPKLTQFSNAFLRILVTLEFSRLMVPKAEHPRKAHLPITRRFDGSVIDEMAVQYANAPLPMFVT
jgi:hypothetical protein